MSERIVEWIFLALAQGQLVVFFAYLLKFRLNKKVLLAVPVVLTMILTVTLTEILTKELAEIFSHSINSDMLSNMIANFIVNYAMLLLMVLFFCKIRYGMLYALIAEVLILLSDGFVYYVGCLLWGDALPSNTFLYMYGQIGTLLVTGLTLIFIAKAFKSIQLSDVPKNYWTLLIVTPISSSIILFSIFTIYQELQNRLIEVFLSVCALFVMFIIVTVFHSKIIDYFNIKVDNQKFILNSNAFIQKQKNMAEFSKAVYQNKHNLKNQLIPILSSLDSGKHSDATKLIRAILGDVDKEFDISYTGVDYVDDMINYKAYLAEEKGISINVANGMNSFPEIPFIDISTAIGIALDNAIEACQTGDCSKSVDISFFCEMGLFYVKIENEFTNKLDIRADGTFLSTKNGVQNHGLGIYSIKNLVERHDGEIKITTDNKKFVLKIILKTN